MADSMDETDSIGDDPNDDGQLTIRIPNPKVYMARQSQWKGRRGKPRCDHCRMNNLKCDRVLPTCNHCSWANGRECKYTPLPTPAHRGIPRCDRCRQKNLKCDRSLPVCNNCSDENENECNYTPKKRHKVPSEHTLARDRQLASYGAKTASFLVSDLPNMEEQVIMGPNEMAGSSGTFYGQNVASSSRTFKNTMSTISYNRGGSSDSESPHQNHMTRYSPSDHAHMWPTESSARQSVPRPSKHDSFIAHSFPSEQGSSNPTTTIQPWFHQSFAPLPDTIIRHVETVNAGEMPDRNSFENSLAAFLAELSPPLRETACFKPDSYATVARALSDGDLMNLSERVRFWTICHHVRSGSNRFHLLLLPRDSFFQLETEEEERLRTVVITQVDGKKNGVTNPVPDSESTAAFERVPVQSQIYDILVYAHRTHKSAFAMLYEIRRMGIATITWPMVEIFIRLCPSCKVRIPSKTTEGAKAEIGNAADVPGYIHGTQ